MSDSPTSPSGFGNVTRHVCSGLARRGHAIDIIGWQASGEAIAWEGCTVHPVRRQDLGADVILAYLQKLRPDVLVTLADVWWLTFIESPFISSFRSLARIPWVLYFPIDGDLGDELLPPSWVRVLQTVDLPVAMSEYGARVARRNGIEAELVPHGVDLDVFRPPTDRAAAKRELGYEGRFVVLSDARNQPRKMLPRTLDVARRFTVGKPNVVFHLHCDPDDPASRSPEYCYDIRADVEALGLEEAVRFSADMSMAAGGLPLERLAAIYQAADAHLLASLGEGFGLPTLQAAAAGVVPLAADATASAELVAGHGVGLPGEHEVLDSFGLRRTLIDLDETVHALETLYRDESLRHELAEAGVRFARRYDWDAIVAEWDGLLRARVPALQETVGETGRETRVTLEATGGDDPLASVRAALPGLLGAVSVDVGVIERKAGELALDVWRDASSAAGRQLTLPVTLAPAVGLVRERVTGCVYLASERDASVARALARVFPGLSAWSSTQFTLGPSLLDGSPIEVKVVPGHDPARDRHLAATTLALDLAGLDHELPWLAASFGVPCVGVESTAGQEELWPELTLRAPDDEAAFDRAREMLVDQGRAQAACAAAADRLLSARTALVGKAV